MAKKKAEPTVFSMKIAKKEKTHPKQIAGAIYKALMGDEKSAPNDVVKLVCVGSASIDNATKAMIIARGYFEKADLPFVYKPSFDTTIVPDKGEVVSIVWEVTKD